MIIEFSGMPKSGKTTCLETTRDYFMRRGRKVFVFSEALRSCPFPSTFRVNTAFWVAHKVLNDIIASRMVYEKSTLVLFDRGLFDAMAFIKLIDFESIQSKTLELSHQLMQENINKYLDLLALWGKYVDAVLLFDTEPELAINRDMAAKMDAGPGIITNYSTIHELKKVYKFLIDIYGTSFTKIIPIITGENNSLDTSLEVRNIILSIDN